MVGCSGLRFPAAGNDAGPRSRPKTEGMPERRWRVTTGPRSGLFLIDIDDGQGFRPATTAEVDAALRQRELFGAADYHAAMESAGAGDARSGGGPPKPARFPAGRTR